MKVWVFEKKDGKKIMVTEDNSRSKNTIDGMS